MTRAEWTNPYGLPAVFTLAHVTITTAYSEQNLKLFHGTLRVLELKLFEWRIWRLYIRVGSAHKYVRYQQCLKRRACFQRLQYGRSQTSGRCYAIKPSRSLHYQHVALKVFEQEAVVAAVHKIRQLTRNTIMITRYRWRVKYKPVFHSWFAPMQNLQQREFHL